MADTVEKLKGIKSLGVCLCMDPCPMELGCGPEFAAEGAEQSSMRVVIATGLYNEALGIETIASDKMQLASLIGLLAVGYDCIMLSHDYVNCWLGRVTKEWQAFIAKCPNWNYAHISRSILPALSKAGVSEGTIRTMTVDNPRSYFGG